MSSNGEHLKIKQEAFGKSLAFCTSLYCFLMDKEQKIRQNSLVVRERLDHLPVDVIHRRLLQRANAGHLDFGHLPEALVFDDLLLHLSPQQKIHTLQCVFINLSTTHYKLNFHMRIKDNEHPVSLCSHQARAHRGTGLNLHIGRYINRSVVAIKIYLICCYAYA